MSTELEVEPSSEQTFSPVVRFGLILGMLGFIAGLFVVMPPGNGSAATVHGLALSPSGASGPMPNDKLQRCLTNWRLASEDGVYFIEYTWKPRHTPAERRRATIMEAYSPVGHASGM